MFGIATEPCDLMPSSDKGPAYYRRLTPWGKWLEMPCPPKTVFVAKWCRCDYPEMEGTCEILIVSMKIIHTFYFEWNTMTILFFNRHLNGSSKGVKNYYVRTNN